MKIEVKELKSFLKKDEYAYVIENVKGLSRPVKNKVYERLRKRYMKVFEIDVNQKEINDPSKKFRLLHQLRNKLDRIMSTDEYKENAIISLTAINSNLKDVRFIKEWFYARRHIQQFKNSFDKLNFKYNMYIKMLNHYNIKIK